MKTFLKVRRYVLNQWGIYDRDPNEFFTFSLLCLGFLVAGMLLLQLVAGIIYNFTFWCIVGVALFYLACHAAMWPEDDAGDDEEDEDDDLDSIRDFEDQDNDNDQD